MQARAKKALWREFRLTARLAAICFVLVLIAAILRDWILGRFA